jgi:hypothetical protein
VGHFSRALKHLTSFHGEYAPHSALRPQLALEESTPAQAAATTKQPTKAGKRNRPRLDWASLHQHTFGNDVLKCPCGGRRTIRALFSTHQAAEERLAALGRPLASRLLPRTTAGPQLNLGV